MVRVRREQTVQHTILRAGVVLLFFPVLVSGNGSATVEAESMSVPEALQAALARNATLEAARARQRGAQAQVTEARSGYLPRLSLAGKYTRHQEPNIVNPIHKAGVFPPLDDDIYEGLAQLTIPVFNGGRTGAELRVAKAFAGEAAAREDLTESEVLRAIGSVFVQADQIEDQNQLLRRRLDTLWERYRELLRFQQEGRVTDSDVALVTSAIEAARSDSLALESQSYELSTRLGQLVGSEVPVRPATQSTEIAAPSLEQILPDGVTEADARNPGLRMAEAAFHQAVARRSFADGMRWPDVGVFGVYTARAGDDRDFVGEWAVGISLQVAVFDGGRRTGATRAAAASADAAREMLRAERQGQVMELRVARDRWSVAALRRERLAEAVAGKSASLSTTEQLYAAGRVSLSELIRQEAELLQMRIDERRAAHSMRLAALDYHSAQGTLTSAVLETLVGGTQ